MTSVSVTVLYWHSQSKMVSNVYKTTGTKDRDIQQYTLYKMPPSLKYSAIQYAFKALLNKD